MEEGMKVLIGILFTVGLLIAGSDGPWFPWVNVIGAVIMSAAVPLSWMIKYEKGE